MSLTALEEKDNPSIPLHRFGDNVPAAFSKLDDKIWLDLSEQKTSQIKNNENHEQSYLEVKPSGPGTIVSS